MATAIICDRCGKVFKAIDNPEYFVFSRNKESNPQYNHEYCGFRIGEPLDLCTMCQSSLKVWVAQGEVNQ